VSKLFTKSQLPAQSRIEEIGPNRPFQILGLLETHELGDLISNVVFLSTLANQFDYARLHVKFRDVRPYSREVMSLSPWIDLAEPLPGEWPRFVQRLFPPTKLLKLLRPMQVGSQKGKNAYVYDVIITSLMAREDAVHALPNPVPLRLPKARSDDLRATLIARGLRPDRWFAIFHYRESGYRYRPGGTDRDSDPAAFECLVDHIINLGGQAVRLGHRGMTPFKPRDGFVDLSGQGNDFLLHAAAVSHARFMIAGPSGPMMLAPAFGIPHTFVDVVDTRAYWDLEHGDVLTHVVTTPKGETLRNARLLASGYLDADHLAKRIEAGGGYRIRKVTSAELAIVANRLYDRTLDCPDWRPPAEPRGGPKPNHFIWPLKLTYPVRWLNI
jgi:putative glycosyltransferase (TIGR04372 family)